MKLIDKLLADTRIIEVRDEGEDGWWAELADGYMLQPDETSAIHEKTLSAIWRSLHRVKPI